MREVPPLIRTLLSAEPPPLHARAAFGTRGTNTFVLFYTSTLRLETTLVRVVLPVGLAFPRISPRMWTVCFPDGSFPCAAPCV